MKKIISVLVASILLTGCGNRNLLFGKQTFRYITCEEDYAPLKNTKIKTWKDYDGEQIEISTEDNHYLISVNKCYMSTEKGE